jgi:hypothetical protein
MNSLAEEDDPTALRVMLQDLPQRLDDAYDEAMERIERQSKDDSELAKRILSWLTCARRPLKVDELRYALAVLGEMTDMDTDYVVDEDILISVCNGLVVIDQGRRVVRLVRRCFFWNTFVQC